LATIVHIQQAQQTGKNSTIVQGNVTLQDNQEATATVYSHGAVVSTDLLVAQKC